MKTLVTGSSGHLGEALVRSLHHAGHAVVGLDILASPFTHLVGSIADRETVGSCMAGVQAVLHTATLHKPHVATHTKQDFIDTNTTGTLNLLEEAAAHGVGAFVFTSTTSTFGHALSPSADAPAAWITEDVVPIPKNIYDALLYRRADIDDIVNAHLLAMDKLMQHSHALRCERYIISATSPFTPTDLAELRINAPAVLARYFADYPSLYAQRGWKMFASIDRVYANDRARAELGWLPRYDFAHVLACLRQGVDFRSPLSRLVSSKGYHAEVFEDGPFPVE